MNRGYLLPEGCKDLIDTWAPKGASSFCAMMPLPIIFTPEQWKTMSIEQFFKSFNSINSKFKGILTVPAQISVLELASMLNQNMSQIFADLMKIGGLAAIKEQLDFVTVSKIAWKYGFIAKRAKE